MRKIILILSLIISLTLTFIGIRGVSSWLKDSKSTKTLEEHLNTIPKLEIITKDEEINETLYNPPRKHNDSYYNYLDEPFLDVDLAKLKQENNDTVYWLEMTGISYPVVRTNNNDYYLNHDFNKKVSKAGWLFNDYRNSDIFDQNTIIYGHRRLDNTMFGPLIKVLNKNYFDSKENNLIKLVTTDESTIWQIISVYTIKKESYYIRNNFLNDNLYQEFLDTILKRSIIKFTDSLNVNDKILTLSTCLDNNGQRIVVHARLIKKETL